MPELRRAGVVIAVLAAVLIMAVVPARAQTGPVLLADRVLFDREARSLTAEGNVEVYYRGARLNAARIRYVDGSDRVAIDGPIRLIDAEGSAVILAEAADLSADLQQGLLLGARMLIDQQVQVSAAQVERIDGRYSRMQNSVATACRICAGGGPPIWEIRADEVVHDQAAQQIYFTGAQLRAFGVPILWLPRLRMPDPTVERLRGFLVPKIINSDNLGLGVKIPYFIPLGDHADITLVPWITDTASKTLEYRYRQAFVNGEIEVDGAVSRDNLTDASWRSFIFAEGTFALPRDYRLEFDLRLVSDPGYLLEYDYSDSDRLQSLLGVEKITPDTYTGAALIGIQSLREDDADQDSPFLTGNALYARRFSPAAIGGVAAWAAYLDGLLRDGSENGDAARDTMRIAGRGDWQRSWQLPAGMHGTAIGRLDGTAYVISQDDQYQSTEFRIAPSLAAEWRWPLIRRGQKATHLIEPVAQLVWSETAGGNVPNDDSVLVEFDETNLFALNRFPGLDRQEVGLRANLGLGYTRLGANGLPIRFVLGRVLRADSTEQFSQPTGLDGTASDWVAATQIAMSDQSGLIGRAVFDNNLTLAKTEFRLDIGTDRFDLATSYLWVEQDPAEGMLADMSEWAFDATYRIQRHWRALADWRYDAVDGEPTRAGFGLVYENECIAVELSASRRFTASRDVSPSTSVRLILSFDGFARRENRPPARQCRT